MDSKEVSARFRIPSSGAIDRWLKSTSQYHKLREPLAGFVRSVDNFRLRTSTTWSGRDIVILLHSAFAETRYIEHHPMPLEELVVLYREILSAILADDYGLPQATDYLEVQFFEQLDSPRGHNRRVSGTGRSGIQ